MRRLGLGLCLVMATWLAYGCETQKAGTMELVFSWPDDAPDLSSSTLYMRGELRPVRALVPVGGVGAVIVGSVTAAILLAEPPPPGVATVSVQ